ncbi:SPOR domain-containing protein [Erythrobacter sp. GH1-10]|uniref:SPOR domain-containing protein n=1 Tax=Erythrobacter sp. GH1-10 TaxID=3349334 RepID=UPI003877E293
MIRGAFAAGAATLVWLAGPALADVKSGVDAWSAGDYDRAVAEWQGPAAAGDADAMFNLAQAYRLGRGVEADIARAKELYAQAAERGHVKAADNFGLLLFQQGEKRSAMPLIRAASDRGDPRAQYVLGLAHFNGDFAEKDWVRAYALLTLSQSAGLPQAVNAIAQMDGYIPTEQRQEAQLLARKLEAEATQRRAAELAAIDLGARPAVEDAAQPSVQPARVATAVPEARKVPQSIQPVPVPASQTKPKARSDWKVQLGAFGVAGNADRLWARLSGNAALSGTSKLLVPTGKVTRLMAEGFSSKAEAQSACAQLKRQGQGCLVTKG